MWVIKCLSFFLVPSRSSSMPFNPPKCYEQGGMLQLLTLLLFHFRLTFESIKELGTYQRWQGVVLRWIRMRDFVLKQIGWICDHLHWWYFDVFQDNRRTCERLGICFDQVSWKQTFCRKNKRIEFAQEEIDFPWHILSREAVRLDPKKLQAIRDWKILVTVKGIRSFLSLANFYRKFIKSFSQLLKLLSDLLKTKLSFEWKEEQEKTFEDLKEKLSPPLCWSFWISQNRSKFTQIKVTLLFMGCSCKMDTQLLSKVKTFMEHNYNGQLMKRNCTSSYVAWKRGNITWGCMKPRFLRMSLWNILKPKQRPQRNSWNGMIPWHC